MNVIRKKLNSQSGATILMALLLFLVAVMVSAVIISAAVSSASALRTEHEQQQSYLTVSSAAELVRDSLLSGDADYTRTVTTVHTSRWGGDIISGPTTVVSPNDKPFSSIVSAAVERYETFQAPYSASYTISAPGYDDVYADFAVKYVEDAGGNYYDMTVWLSNGDGADDYDCCMVLNAKGREYMTSQSARDDYTGYYTDVRTTTVRWDTAEISKKDS